MRDSMMSEQTEHQDYSRELKWESHEWESHEEEGIVGSDVTSANQ